MRAFYAFYFSVITFLFVVYCKIINRTVIMVFDGEVHHEVIIVVGPSVALLHDGAQRLLLTFGRIVVFLQQALHQSPHVGTLRLSAIPVDGAIPAQHLGQLLREVHQLLIRVEVLHRLRFGQDQTLQ